MAKSVYLCERCGRQFGDWEEAEKCEATHVEPSGIANMWGAMTKGFIKWSADPEDTVDTYPTFIPIDMRDGATVLYTRVNGKQKAILRTAKEYEEIKKGIENLKSAVELIGTYKCRDCGHNYSDPNWTKMCPECGSTSRGFTKEWEKYNEACSNL